MSALDEISSILRDSSAAKSPQALGALRDRALLEFLQHYTIETDEAGKPRVVDNISTKTELNSPVVFTVFESAIAYFDGEFGEKGEPLSFLASDGKEFTVPSQFERFYQGRQEIFRKKKWTEQDYARADYFRLFDALFKINMVSKDRKSREEAARVLVSLAGYRGEDEEKAKDARKM